MNENINLCEIFKGCPIGTKFFSYVHGPVEFHGINNSKDYPILIKVFDNKNNKFCIEGITSSGRYAIEYKNSKCILVPSLEQPDWSKWEGFKIPKFDFKTLKPFDKVLVRTNCDANWRCDFYSNYGSISFPFVCIRSSYKQCIPYNDETKHLVGTRDEAPEYYRYWED